MITCIAPAPTKCIHGQHTLVCSCGDALQRVAAGDEWTYISMRTNRSQESELPKPLTVMSWDELAEANIEVYSILSAREKLGMLYARHQHRPEECTGHKNGITVPTCCSWPMRYAPSGWVCRVERHG